MKMAVKALVMSGAIITLLTFVAAESYSADMIYACVSKSGQIRIVNSIDSCKHNESSLQWEYGESGLNSLNNTWVASTAYNIDRAESNAWCVFGGILIGGGCECASGGSNCNSVLSVSRPEHSDLNNNGTMEDSWKCVCVNAFGSPCNSIAAGAYARCAD
jgi:hypothetical protein